MSRLPTVSGDGNAWGAVLNDFLSVAHNADGSLKPLGPYYYLPSRWDSAWKTAKANAVSSRVNVIGIGDSITQGWNSTDFMLNSWWAKLRAAILAANGNRLGGDHYGLMYSAAYQTNLGSPTTATPPLVVSGVYGTDYTQYYAGFNLVSSANNSLSPYITCTPPYNVTGFDILYVDFGGGSWTYQIDGGSTTTVTCTGPFTNAGSMLKKVSITGLTSASHTLRINGGASGAATCLICGITGYSGTTGLCFANMGCPGMGLFRGLLTDNALSETTRFPVDRLALYQGYQGTTASPTSLLGLGFPMQPDLAIIALGVNDASVGVSRANFRDALDRLVWSLRYGKADACSIIICAMYNGDGTVASSTAVQNTDCGANGATIYRDLRAAMLEVAQAENCAFVDVHGALGRTPVTNGWITSVNDVHPTDTGHLNISNLIGAIV